MPKIKNIIIFIAIAAVLILVYIFFLEPAPTQQNLISSGTTNAVSTNTGSTPDQNSAISQDFLSTLLNINSLKLDGTIFSDPAFTNLHDSSILLTIPTDEGRANPFAPIGVDATPSTPATMTTNPSTPSTSSGQANSGPSAPTTPVKTP